jgi:hypothetical protein
VASIRLGKQSSGIQFAPRAKIGTSLTTIVNADPTSSALVSRRTERNPIRRVQLSSVEPLASSRVTSRS